MNIFKNKFLIKLIATLCLFLALISFGAPTTVHADPGDDDDGWGGVLITPVVKLLTALGDGVMEVLHSSVQSQKIALIKVDGSNFWETAWAIFGAAVVGLIVATAVIFAVTWTGGTAIPALLAMFNSTAAVSGTVVAIAATGMGGAAGLIVGFHFGDKWIPNDLYLPAFTLTAEEIFSNEIALFDVNFFDTSTRYTKIDTVVEKIDYDERALFSTSVSTIQENSPKWVKFYNIASGSTIAQFWENDSVNSGTLQEFKNKEEFNNYDWSKYSGGNISISDYASNESLLWIIDAINQYQQEDNLDILSIDSGHTIIGKGFNNTTENNFVTCIKILSPRGEVKFTINYTYASGGQGPQTIKITREAGSIYASSQKEVPMVSTAQQLNGIVSQWYFILRNLALLVLMVVLIYTGIRITIASTAGDKAKYKERLIDWIVAMCLIFVMHYIMVFAVELVDRITKFVQAETNLKANGVVIPLTDEQFNSAKKLFVDDENGQKLVKEGVAALDTTTKKLAWQSDLTGLFRIQSQLTGEGTSKWVGYSFAYFVLVLFTLFFAWTYLKRIVYMTFLTMIAPLVAMTYPIDKITDGKAQAFNAWIKEYIFNLLIQPMHLLLYAVLVSSAYQLASESVIYTLVALGFMIPAEKLLRKFFGFEKASTPGLLGGAAGAALAMTGINKLLGHRPKSGSSGGKSSGGNESKDTVNTNYQIDSESPYSLIAGNAPSGMKDETVSSEKQKDDKSNIIPFNSKRESEEIEDGEEKNKLPKLELTKRRDSEESNDVGEEENIDSNKQEKVLGKKTAEELKRERNETEWEKFKEGRKLKNKYESKKKEREQRRNEFWQRPQVRGFVAASGAYGRTLKNRAIDKMVNGHPIRAIAKGAAGLAGAATFGAMGLAAGAVSGDPSKAFQYAGGAALGGAKFGSSSAGAVMKATSVDKDYLEEQYEMAAYGDEYKKYKLEEQKKKMLEDEKYIDYLQKSLGISREDAQSVLNTTGSDCFGEGVTSAEDIAIIHEMTHPKQGKPAVSMQEAIAVKKISDQYSVNPKTMMKDKRDKYEATLRQNYMNAGYNENEAEEYMKKTIKLQTQYFDQKSALKKVKL